MADLDPAAVERLKDILSSEGGSLENPARLRGLISDRLSSFRRERQALTAALSIGVPQRLRSRQAKIVDARFRADVSYDLQQQAPLDPDTADWAVGAWAAALGLGETIASGSAAEAPHEVPLRWYRKPSRLAALAGGAAVVGLFLVGTVLGAWNGETTPGDDQASPTNSMTPTDEPSATATASQAPTAPPTPEFESRPLLQWIPADIRPTCVAVGLNLRYRVYNRGYACSLDGVDGLWYASYASLDAMYTAYYVGFGMRPFAEAGECPTDTPSDGTWHFTDAPDITHGRIACYRGTDDLSYLHWTMEYARVFVTMESDSDIEYLYEQWRNMPKVTPGP